MTSFLTKIVTKKIFAETPLGKKTGQNATPADDPYFETVPATRLGIKTTKKRKRALPPGLTPEEEKVLTKVKRRAYRLDLALFSFCGIRFGWSSVIGIVPAIGDFSDMLLALMVYRTACSIDPPLSPSTKLKMQLNIAMDFLIGIVPFIGDLADAAFKCNTRNAVLLEGELRERGKKRLRQSGQPIPADPSLADEFDYQEEAALRNERGAPPRYTSRRDKTHGSRRDQEPDLEAGRDVPPPQPARTR